MPRIARVVRIVQTTVAAVILLGYFLAKILINIPSQSRVKCQWRINAPGILHDFPGVRGCLEEDVDEDELVEDGEGEAEPP